MSRERTWWRRVPAPVVDLALVLAAAADVLVNFEEEAPLGLALAALGCAALAFRRRFPLAVFVLTLPLALMQDVALATLVALFTLAERSRNRRLLAGCAVLAAAVGTVPWPLLGPAELGRITTAIYAAYNLATAAAPVLMGQLVRAQRKSVRQLAEIQEAREHERALYAQAVLARERAQLAREMHDVVSHQVSLIAVQAGALQVATQDPDAEQAARTIRTLSVTTLDELRTMVRLLRASGGRDTELTPQPTLADLRRLVESSGIPAELTGQLPATVSTPAQRAVYRTVQEALTNVRKHAPGATARVELRQEGERIGVTVTNTPATRPALPLPGSQLGLVGLGERAEILNGSLEAGPTPDGGYRVRLRLPFDPA
ncbi:signal transduction histidine kinase [Kitasatospora gansuensis]|uniref:histidine kinase n=1 Tax=Kitasatospora gansuensis TaxID=258050 RepID=A0A7W7SJH1_9ACTN|nr:histidine kinase [Kitasatospora gansuensis]MBB4951038.1 signal transduction histidine kinase [Kitasatospora gansuensis]